MLKKDVSRSLHATQVARRAKSFFTIGALIGRFGRGASIVCVVNPSQARTAARKKKRESFLAKVECLRSLLTTASSGRRKKQRQEQIS